MHGTRTRHAALNMQICRTHPTTRPPPPPFQDTTSPIFGECPGLATYAGATDGSEALSGSISIGLGYAGNNNTRYGTNFNCTW